VAVSAADLSIGDKGRISSTTFGPGSGGDVRVAAGTITLSLAPEAHYDIDARSRVGSVFSDFPGNERTRLWFFNHQFAEHPSGAAEKLYLRIGFGDIVLLKKR